MYQYKNLGKNLHCISLLLVFICLSCLGRSNAFGPNSSLIQRYNNNVNSVYSTNTIVSMSSSSSSNNDTNEEDVNNDNKSNVSGSFFNPVPPKKDEDNASVTNGSTNGDATNGDATNGDAASSSEPSEPSDPFEASMLELMRNRNKKPLASEPSTVGGVPTSQAKGKE